MYSSGLTITQGLLHLSHSIRDSPKDPASRQVPTNQDSSARVFATADLLLEIVIYPL
jgi:hypothetical protein